MPWLNAHQQLLPLCWSALGGLLLGADYFVGPNVRFSSLFFIPVLLASWFSGRWGLGLAIGIPLIRLTYAATWDGPWTLLDMFVNTGIQIIGLGVLAVFVQRTAEQRKKIRILEGLLPICSFCKKIRDSDKHWEPLEGYIGSHSEAQFSHGVCPECARVHYSDLTLETSDTEIRARRAATSHSP